MGFSTLEPATFLRTDVFCQDEFLEGLANHDWSRYRGRQVLVRGCGDVLTPPWAFMAITARLVEIARSVRYGNEHDNVVVYRNDRREPKSAADHVSS